MDPYHFGSQPPPPLTAAYQHQSYLGSPHHSLNPYQPTNVAPYPLPNEYITQYPSQQMYMHTAPPTVHPMPPPPPFVSGAYPYNHPIYEEEPSCFVSFLENFCCCFGFGVPQNHYEAIQKHEMQRRRLIAKEERNRIKQYQKAQQEKQRLAQIQQQSATNTTTAAANKNTAAAATTRTNDQ